MLLSLDKGSTSPAPGTGCGLAGAPGGQKLSSCPGKALALTWLFRINEQFYNSTIFPGKCEVTFLNMKPHRKGCLGEAKIKEKGNLFGTKITKFMKLGAAIAS